jgi:hypothetical protein
VKKLLLTLALILLTAAPAAAMTGAEILEQQRERHSVSSGKCKAEMMLVDGKGNEQARVLKFLTKEDADGRDFLAVFLEPDDVRGTALLAKMPDRGKSELYLYLPAAGAMQRISGAGKKNAFMGSDFTFEDLQPEPIENFEYEILRSEVLDGQNCWVIRAVPADRRQARASAYSKRLLWITKAHMATLRVEFYDRRENLEKFLVNKKITIWRPEISIMENAKTGHKTIITLIGEEEVNIPLEDSLFSTEALVNRVHCK